MYKQRQKQLSSTAIVTITAAHVNLSGNCCLDLKNLPVESLFQCSYIHVSVILFHYRIIGTTYNGHISAKKFLFGGLNRFPKVQTWNSRKVT